MDSVKKEVLERVEATLRHEFMSNLAKTHRQDSHEMMAEIFNNFDRNTETKFMESLEQFNPEAAERIRDLMFTFDDLGEYRSDRHPDAYAEHRQRQNGDCLERLRRTSSRNCSLPICLNGRLKSLKKIWKL